MRLITTFFCSLLIMGCSSFETVQDLNPKIYYKPDIIVEYDGKDYDGWGVLPAQKEQHYELKFEAPGTIDLLKVHSCGRFNTDEPRGGIFKNDKKYKYTYRPDIKLELMGECPLLVEAYEAGKPGRHAFGIFAVDGGQYDLESMPATVKCNGVDRRYAGVSMCVTLEGVKQMVVFETPVELLLDKIKPSCQIPESPNGTEWIFKTKNRECTYLFREAVGQRRFARHLSVGFEEVAVRRYK